MSGMEIAIYCVVGLGAVMWLLHRPVERGWGQWRPCHHCKHVWRLDEHGDLELMTPLCWNHFKNCNDLCPRCAAALMEIEEIERHTIV